MTTIARRRITAHEFRRMAEAGVFGEDERLELVEGDLIEMTPTGRGHAGFVNRLTRLFAPLASDASTGVSMSVQNPLALSLQSEVYPDFMLLKFREDDYMQNIPTPRDVLLVVEVAHSSLSYDRMTKAPLYARAGVPELWLLEVQDKRLWVYRRPKGEAYEEIVEVARGEGLELTQLAGVTVETGELLR